MNYEVNIELFFPLFRKHICFGECKVVIIMLSGYGIITLILGFPRMQSFSFFLFNAVFAKQIFLYLFNYLYNFNIIN